MNKDKQRIAIAEACGWREMPTKALWRFRDTETYAQCNERTAHNCTQLPDYLNDLNAMHEAEEVLTDLQARRTYSQTLLRVTKVFDVIETHASDFSGTELDYDALTDFAHATAAQRAEAFLRTLGKWEASS